ncbi:uncharacterized protein LOC130138091 [Syzygium oleosum]|uniref:uncharacterized protein LOC130138091 n=1 Tax=Syzygium oleosum TaxID=219896 RepID=UPI0024B89F12|nr:uncharacterized protein LOC130138091 [Syzygium oleosum]
MIAPFGDSFTDSTHVVRRLNKIIDNYWMGQFSSWTTAPKEVKELWWNEFKADELGTEPTFMATFERTFQKKDKTWTGNRAKVIKDKYDELVMSTAAASGDGDGDGAAASEPSVDSMALWMEASGGMRRGQIFGMGSLSRMYRTPATATSSSSALF